MGVYFVKVADFPHGEFREHGEGRGGDYCFVRHFDGQLMFVDLSIKCCVDCGGGKEGGGLSRKVFGSILFRATPRKFTTCTYVICNLVRTSHSSHAMSLHMDLGG